MYIVFTADNTEYSFQLKDEAGVDIGTPDAYSVESYRIDYSDPVHFAVQLIDAPNGNIPPIAAYPKHRTIFKNNIIPV